MNCLVLQTSEGKHLGFILCHFNDGAKMGDCVFSIIPTDPSLFDDETTHLLFTRKNIGESTIQIDADPPRILRVRSPGLPVMVISLDENGLGEWGKRRLRVSKGEVRCDSKAHQEAVVEVLVGDGGRITVE